MNDYVNDFTDKHSVHSYTSVYEDLFTPIKESCTAILEIGVQTGGSIRMWNNFFLNAIVYGIDIDIYQNKCRETANRVRLINGDAYSYECANTFGNETLDIVIDDGPHTLQSMKSVIDLYYRTIKPGGYLIIEDIQDISWIDILQKQVDPTAKWRVIDRRHIKGRYDDILIVIQKPTNQV